eukprot:TRINITY_DN9312_c0_g1_i2.p3 TRINITY_DN9312_c0_g1~~TRINITY_DN9312_c0_g1_i2.p3  ORF type:complete len:127 (-),score=26.58 TRINITY_DN9312_c0_g1_i2:176-556(-)
MFVILMIYTGATFSQFPSSFSYTPITPYTFSAPTVSYTAGTTAPLFTSTGFSAAPFSTTFDTPLLPSTIPSFGSFPASLLQFNPDFGLGTVPPPPADTTNPPPPPEVPPPPFEPHPEDKQEEEKQE